MIGKLLLKSNRCFRNVNFIASAFQLRFYRWMSTTCMHANMTATNMARANMMWTVNVLRISIFLSIYLPVWFFIYLCNWMNKRQLLLVIVGYGGTLAMRCGCIKLLFNNLSVYQMTLSSGGIQFQNQFESSKFIRRHSDFSVCFHLLNSKRNQLINLFFCIQRCFVRNNEILSH